MPTQHGVAISSPPARPPSLKVRNGQLETASALLKLGADVRAADHHGSTPLHRAAYSGNAAMARLLLDAKAPIAIVDRYGRTPLHVAADNGQLRTVKLLHQRGSPLWIKAPQSLE